MGGRVNVLFTLSLICVLFLAVLGHEWAELNTVCTQSRLVVQANPSYDQLFVAVSFVSCIERYDCVVDVPLLRTDDARCIPFHVPCNQQAYVLLLLIR